MSLEKDNQENTLIAGGFLRRKLRSFFSSNAFLYMIPILLFSYFFIIPCFYISQYYFPGPSEVKYSEGVFIYKYSGRNGAYAGIEKNGKADFFSCASKYNMSNNCELDRKLYPKFRKKGKDTQEEVFISLQGKPAKITWFTQKLSVFATQRRLVELVVDGEVVIPKERVRENIERYRDGWLSRLMLYLLGLLITVLLARKFIFKGRTKESNNE